MFSLIPCVLFPKENLCYKNETFVIMHTGNTSLHTDVLSKSLDIYTLQMVKSDFYVQGQKQSQRAITIQPSTTFVHTHSRAPHWKGL